MSQRQDYVRSLVLPLERGNVLVPGALISEVISYVEARPVANAPAWILGVISWRGIALPVVSMEIATGGMSPTVGVRARVAVLSTLSSESEVSFYGVVVQALPKVVLASKETVRAKTDQGTLPPFVYAEVELESGYAMIPNFQGLEAELSKTRYPRR